MENVMLRSQQLSVNYFEKKAERRKKKKVKGKNSKVLALGIRISRMSCLASGCREP